MKKNNYLICLLVTSAFAVSACNSPEEKVVSETKEAQQEVGRAQMNVRETEQKAAQEIRKADPEDKADEKVEATKDIAAAERKVDDEKVEATKEVTDAEQKAGAGGSYIKE